MSERLMREESALRSAILNWMRRRVVDHVDARTGEVNCTGLAEECANFGFDHPEWLDDPNHVIWDMAVEAADRHAALPAEGGVL